MQLNSQGIRVGVRSGFSNIDTYYEDVCRYPVPVEITMPKVDDMLMLIDQGMSERLRQLISVGELSVLSIHAPSARISNNSFMGWASEIFSLSNDLGVRSVTFHPDYCKPNRRSRVQSEFLDVVREAGGQDLYSMETFVGQQRLFTPEDIVSLGMPMTLDTAHIFDRTTILSIVERHHQMIKTVHLSSVSEAGQHQPIDRFCIDLMRLLQELGWSGDCVLEYMQDHHDRLVDDSLSLCEALSIKA